MTRSTAIAEWILQRGGGYGYSCIAHSTLPRRADTGATLCVARYPSPAGRPGSPRSLMNLIRSMPDSAETDTPGYKAIREAAELLEQEAGALARGHAPFGDWGADGDVKAAHDDMLAKADALRALLPGQATAASEEPAA